MEDFSEVALNELETPVSQTSNTELEMHIGNTEKAGTHSVDGSRDGSSRISNEEVVDLFYSIFEDFSKVKTEELLKALENTKEKKQKLHSIVCKMLRFPVGSVLKGSFNTGSFRIDVVEDSVSDKIQKQCELNKVTVEYVLEVNKKLKGMRKRADKLHKVLCMKAEVDEEMIDKFILERKVRKKEYVLKRYKEDKLTKKIETLLKSVFYLTMKKRDLIKELQESPENLNFHYLQNQNTELINGLVMDVFEALKGDLAEVRKVLCNRFTKVLPVKAIAFYEDVIKCVKKVENLKEADKANELEIFMNSSFFHSDSSGKASSEVGIGKTWVRTTEKENEKAKEKDNRNKESCNREAKQDSYLIPHTRKETEDVSENDNNKPLFDSKITCNDSSSDEDQNIDLILEVQEGQNYSVENNCGKRKRKAYDNAFKLSAVRFAEKESNNAAQRKFGVSEKCVRSWRKSKTFLENAPKTSKKNVSVSKDLLLIEEDLKKWFQYYQGKGSVLTKKAVMMKAKALAKEAKYKIDTNRYVFGKTWCDRFMKTSGLVSRRRTRGTIKEEVNSLSQDEVESESGSMKSDDDSSFDEADDTSSIDADDSDGEDTDCYHEESSNMCPDEKLIPKETECKEKADLLRDSPEIETDKLKHLDLNCTGTETAVGSQSEEFVTSNNDTQCEMMSRDKKRKSGVYDAAFKLKVVKCAEEYGKAAAAQEFDVQESLVDVWRKSQNSAENKPKSKRQCRFPTALEQELVTWIKHTQESGSKISASMAGYKARLLCEKEKYNIDVSDFNFSYRWFNRLIERHGLPVKRKKGSVRNRSAAENSCDDIDKELPSELLGVPTEPVSDLSDRTLDGKTTRKSYNNAFKSSVISFAESSSNDLAVKVFNVPEKLVRDWRKAKDIILNGPKDRRRHVVRQGTFEELEQDLVSWCRSEHKNHKIVSRNAVRIKARQLAKEGRYNVDTSQFKASNGWCSKFLKRNGYCIDDARTRKAKSKQRQDADMAGEIAHQDECKSTLELTKPGCTTTASIESDGKPVEGSDNKIVGSSSGKEVAVKLEKVTW